MPRPLSTDPPALSSVAHRGSECTASRPLSAVGTRRLTVGCDGQF